MYGPKHDQKQVKVNIIDLTGRTVMPGLIDAHAHTMRSDIGWRVIDCRSGLHYARAWTGGLAAVDPRFYCVRNVGGPSFFFKRAIDEGVIPGPKIWLRRVR